MSINITSRHAEITEALKDHVNVKMDGIIQSYPQVEHIHVVLDIQKFHQIVEVVVQAKNHLHVEAKEDSDDMYKSIDLVIDKVDRQLRRHRDKVVDHKTGKHRARLSDFEQKLSEGASG